MKRFLQLRPKMPNPLLLLAATLLLLGWGVTFENSMNKRHSELRNARTSYLKSLTTTKTQLSGLVAKITNDSTLRQNIRWNLSNSVNRRLKNNVQRGVLDQIYIWDGECNLIANAFSNKALPNDCPKKVGGSFETNTFVWLTIKDVPTLALTKKFDDSKKTAYVVGLVQLDDNWVNLQGEFKKMYSDLNLSIAKEDSFRGATIIKEGKSPAGLALAALGTSSFADKFLGAGNLSENPMSNAFFWPLWGLMAIFTTMVWWQNKEKNLQNKYEQISFVSWCKSLSPIAEFTMPGKFDNEPQETRPLQDAQKYISQAIQTKNDAMRGATRKRGDLEKTIKSLEVEIQHYQKRLAELAELDSLAIQLQRTTGSFLNKMSELHNRSEEISDTLDTAIAENAQSLNNIMAEWQRGVEERGTRKFIRSLAETPGNANFETLLDEQIHTIINITASLRDTSLTTSINANELVEIASFASRVASLWHGIALSSDQDDLINDFGEIIEESQELIKLEEDLSEIEFRNLIAELDQDQVPMVSKTIWTSAMYHIYLGLADLIKNQSGFGIVSRFRKESGRNILAISLFHQSRDAEYPKHNENLAHQLEISRSMLIPYNIKLNVLPTLNGPFPIALSWANEELLLEESCTKLLFPNAGTANDSNETGAPEEVF